MVLMLICKSCVLQALRRTLQEKAWRFFFRYQPPCVYHLST